MKNYVIKCLGEKLNIKYTYLVNCYVKEKNIVSLYTNKYRVGPTVITAAMILGRDLLSQSG